MKLGLNLHDLETRRFSLSHLCFNHDKTPVIVIFDYKAKGKRSQIGRSLDVVG